MKATLLKPTSEIISFKNNSIEPIISSFTCPHSKLHMTPLSSVRVLVSFFLSFCLSFFFVNTIVFFLNEEESGQVTGNPPVKSFLSSCDICYYLLYNVILL